MPLHGNERGCNLASHFPLLTHTPMHACFRASAGARAPLWSVYFDLHVCFMSVENAFHLASSPPPLQMGSQIKLGSCGSGGCKHTGQVE